jgi:hypothetical protein
VSFSTARLDLWTPKRETSKIDESTEVRHEERREKKEARRSSAKEERPRQDRKSKPRPLRREWKERTGHVRRSQPTIAVAFIASLVIQTGRGNALCYKLHKIYTQLFNLF